MIRVVHPRHHGKALRWFLALLLLSQPFLIDSALARTGSHYVPEPLPDEAAPPELFRGGDFWWDGFGDPSTGGLGLNAEAWAMTVWNELLIVGGDFTQAGPLAVNRIAAFNGVGESWSALDDGFNGRVNALAVFDGELYAGGSFSASGFTALNGVARWDGAAWQPLGSGLNTGGYLRDLAVIEGKLVVAGHFSSAGGVAAANIAVWDGADFTALGLGFEDSTYSWPDVYDVNGYNGGIVASGWFDSADGSPAANIAFWDGLGWSDLGLDTDNYVFDSEILPPETRDGDERLAVGGCFTQIGGISALYMAMLMILVWSPFTLPLLSQPIYSMMTFGNLGQRQMLLGGHFLTAGSAYAGLALLMVFTLGVWQFLMLGSGLGMQGGYPGVFCAAVYMGFLFMGGLFRQIGEYQEGHPPGSSCFHIARYGEGDYTPVFLSSMDLTAEAGGVRIGWELSEDSDPADLRLLARHEGETWQLPFIQTEPGVYSAHDGGERYLEGGRFDFDLSYRETGQDWTLLRSENVRVAAYIPPAAAMLPARPNPFNPSTELAFELPVASRARVAIYGTDGRLLKVLADRSFEAGRHTLQWNGRDAQGHDAPAGVYLARLASPGTDSCQKLVLLK